MHNYTNAPIHIHLLIVSLTSLYFCFNCFNARGIQLWFCSRHRVPAPRTCFYVNEHMGRELSDQPSTACVPPLPQNPACHESAQQGPSSYMKCGHAMRADGRSTCFSGALADRPTFVRRSPCSLHYRVGLTRFLHPSPYTFPPPFSASFSLRSGQTSRRLSTTMIAPWSIIRDLPQCSCDLRYISLFFSVSSILPPWAVAAIWESLYWLHSHISSRCYNLRYIFCFLLYAIVLPLSIKTCDFRFSRSQTVSTLTKFI
jgi:hypothetical protein